MTALAPNELTGMSDREIENRLNTILVEQFEVDPASLSPDAHLFDDLGMDSIDAVDLLLYLKELTGIRIPPEEFQAVRTLGDVVGVVKTLIREC